MTIERIAAKGIGPFVEPVELDLRPFEGKLVALCGDNGEGKTSLLECIPGAFYRKTPSQGALASLASDIDAYVEVDAITDRPYRIRQILSAGGRNKSTVVDNEGIPQLNSADVSEFDRWADRHLPDPKVFFTSDFASQGAAPFAETRRLIDEKAADRKDILLQALGVSHLEALAVLARGHATEADKELSAARALVKESERRLVDMDELRRRIEMLEASSALARRESDTAQASHHAAANALQGAIALDADAKVRRDRLDDCNRRLATLVEQADEANTKHAQAASVLDKRAEVERAQIDLVELRTLLSETRYAHAQARSAQQSKQGEANTEMQAASRAAQRAKLGRSEEHIASLRRDLDNTMAAMNRLLDETMAVEHARQRVKSLEKEIEQLQRATVHGAFDRIEGLAGRLEHVASWHTLETTWDGSVERIERYAQDGLDEDTSFAAVARKAPRTMEQRRLDLAQAKEALEAADRKHRTTATLAGRVPDVRRSIGEAEASRDAATAAAEEAAGHTAKAREANAEAQSKDAELRKLGKQIADMEARSASLETTIRGSNIERAKAEAEHFSVLAVRLEAEIESLHAERQGLGDIPMDIPVLAAETAALTAKQAAANAAEILRAAEEKVSLARADLVTAQADRARHAELSRQVDACMRELSEWNRLGKDLGKNGVQALEIDATGPELATLANELLHTCYGSRWSISIATSKAASTKKRGEVEGFFIRVIDTLRGREGMVESYSGGERVLLGEAISLALTIIASKRARAVRPTLIRDESGAALTEDRGRAYAAMLRMAAKMIGAHCVIFVSHSPTLQQLADVRVFVENGKLRVA